MIPIDAVMRVVQPMDNLEQITNMYADRLCFEVIGSFDGHGDFSGRMLGHPKHYYHLEFTTHIKEKTRHAPTLKNLLVYYVPDDIEFANVIDTIFQFGFIKVDSFNLYWDDSAQAFENIDGYRVVINNGASTF